MSLGHSGPQFPDLANGSAAIALPVCVWWGGLLLRMMEDSGREGGKALCKLEVCEDAQPDPHGPGPFPPNLQDLFQLLLRVDHDDVGTAVMGDVPAGFGGAGCVDASDDATAGDPGGCVSGQVQWATPLAQPPARHAHSPQAQRAPVAQTGSSAQSPQAEQGQRWCWGGPRGRDGMLGTGLGAPKKR